MKKEHFLLIVVLIIVISAIALRLTSPKSQIDNKKEENKIVSLNQTEEKSEVAKQEIASSTESETTPQVNPVADVSLISPVPGQIVTSPLTVSGKARGNWFFEATLPIKIIAEDGTVIAQHYGQAQSDWMTKDFVEFKSVLEFTTTSTSGYLVIAKDNPSGLPEYDDSVSFPILFK